MSSKVTNWILNPPYDSESTSDIVGGKALNLIFLNQNGITVPPFIVITTDFFTTYISEMITPLTQQLAHCSEDECPSLLNAIRDTIIATVLPETVLTELTDTVTNISPNGAFAVRSSAIGEDSAAASFAGQMDSYLYLQNDGTLIKYVLHCLASAFSDRAVLYRIQNQLPILDIRSGVIIQQMIDPEVSGVLFTANPTSGNRKEMMVSACYGVGEGVVSGDCDTDEFVLSLDGAISRRTIQTKKEKIGFNPTGTGTAHLPVNLTDQDRSCLSDSQLHALVHIARKITDLKQRPQDIEWAIKGNQIHILQTRDITALPPYKDPAQRIVWDNSNIEESYCGITTPLTFSFARRAYRTVYEQTARMMRVSDSTLSELNHNLGNLLGLIDGRVYYNINNWYCGLGYLPSFSKNKSDMERMMGLKDPVDFVTYSKLSFLGKLRLLPRMATLITRFLYFFSKMPQRVDVFTAHFNAIYASVDRRRLHERSISELLDLLRHLDNELLKKWHTPIINDFYVMMMNGKIHRLIQAIDPELDPIVNHLMAGEDGIQSTEPTKFLLRLSEKIRTVPGLADELLRRPASQGYAYLQRHSPQCFSDVETYIELYGDRCTGELKLESVTLRQDPTFIFLVIQNYLKQPELSEEILTKKEKSLRTAAEIKVFSKIKSKSGRRGLRQFKSTLNRLRAAVKNRENMRLLRTRLFGMYRDIYLEIGSHWALQHVISMPNDIFYITCDEINDYYFGAIPQHELKSLIALRRREYDGYANEPVSHHFETLGSPYHGADYSYTGDLTSATASSDQFKGTPCYPGIVTKRVRVIHDPKTETDLNGDILCTVRTDPGWAPLFLSAGEILVERGSTLSHSAVVARELGIPAVVGIHGITQRLKTGDLITLNGETGVITIHAPQ